MKKKIFTFIIILLLTSLSIHIIFAASSKYNYRNTWNSWSDYNKYVYLWGFEDGSGFSATKASDLLVAATGHKPLLDSEADLLFEYLERTWWKIGRFDNEVIIDVIDGLYKDASNAYIPFDIIIDIALEKLQGNSVDELLLNERKRASK